MKERIHSIKFIKENKGIADGSVKIDDFFNSTIKDLVKVGGGETSELNEYLINALTIHDYEQLNIKSRQGSGYHPNTDASDSFDCMITWLGDAGPGDQDTLVLYEITIHGASLVNISDYQVENDYTRTYKNCSLRIPYHTVITVVKNDSEDEDI